MYIVGDPSINLSESGGHIRHIKECVHALEQLGHEVRVLTSGGGEGSVDQKKAFASAKRLMPRFASKLLKEVALLTYDKRFVTRIRQNVMDFRPEFIYNRHALFHRSGVTCGKQLGIPVILEVNALITHEADKYFGIGLKSLASRYEREAFNLATVLVVVSAKLKDELIEYGVPGEKISVNPNGADPDKFKPSVDASAVRRKYALEGKTVVGFLGSLVPWHGVPNLVEAARVICPKYPDVRFMIVGNWTETDPSVRRAAEYGLTDKMVFTGAVPLDEAPVYINAMDIATAPYADPTQVYGSSTKFYEYMACERAIIASRLGQMADVIEDGVSGMLVKAGDTEDLTNKLLYLIERPELRKEMGARARQAMLENYTWKRNAERIIGLYQEIRA